MKNIPDGYVRMGKHICQVCGTTHNSGEILLNKQLKSIPEHQTITGYSLCKQHQEQFDLGYIFLIEAISHNSNATCAKREDVTFTGKMASIKEHVFQHMFNVDIPKKRICFVEPEVFNKILQLVQ